MSEESTMTIQPVETKSPVVIIPPEKQIITRLVDGVLYIGEEDGFFDKPRFNIGDEVCFCAEFYYDDFAIYCGKVTNVKSHQLSEYSKREYPGQERQVYYDIEFKKNPNDEYNTRTIMTGNSVFANKADAVRGAIKRLNEQKREMEEKISKIDTKIADFQDPNFQMRFAGEILK